MTDSIPQARERIFQAAHTLFSRRGYRGTSVQDIVEMAGVTKPTLYYYYESKARLYLRLVEHVFDLRLEKIKEAQAGVESIQEKLTAMTVALMEFSRVNSESMQIAYANLFSAPEEVPAEVRGCHKIQGTFDFVQGLIEEAQRRGELNPEMDSIQLTSAIYGHFILAASTLSLNPHRWKPN